MPASRRRRGRRQRASPFVRQPVHDLTHVDVACTSGQGSDGHIYLRHPESPEEPAVAFGAHLAEVEGGAYGLSGIVKNESLAHSVGLRNGDELIGVNGTKIEGRGVPYLLKLLRHEVLPHVLLQVKRPQKKPKFVSTFFEQERSTQDGTYEVTVKGISKRDDDVIDWADLSKSIAVYGWLGPPVDSYDIWIPAKSPRYLSISQNQLIFGPFREDGSPFYRYNYFGPTPSNGSAVAYSQHYYKEPITSAPTTLQATQQGSNPPLLQISRFEKYLLSPFLEENSRLFTERFEEHNYSLRAVEPIDLYIADVMGRPALSSKPTMLNIQLSRSDDLGGC